MEVPVVGCDWDACCVVVSDARCPSLRGQAWQKGWWRWVGAGFVKEFVAFAA